MVPGGPTQWIGLLTLRMPNSRFSAPGSEAVDTFTSNWAEDNNWWFPPVYLIPHVIRHAQSSGAQSTLIVPQWLSSPFWPLLFLNCVDPAEFVVEYLELGTDFTRPLGH